MHNSKMLIVCHETDHDLVFKVTPDIESFHILNFWKVAQSLIFGFGRYLSSVQIHLLKKFPTYINHRSVWPLSRSQHQSGVKISSARPPNVGQKLTGRVDKFCLTHPAGGLTRPHERFYQCCFDCTSVLAWGLCLVLCKAFTPTGNNPDKVQRGERPWL